MLPWRRDWLELAKMLLLLKYVQKATIIESSMADHSTVNNKKGFVLAFFVIKSSRNSSKCISLSLSLSMYRMLGVDNLSWNITTA